MRGCLEKFCRREVHLPPDARVVPPDPNFDRYLLKVNSLLNHAPNNSAHLSHYTKEETQVCQVRSKKVLLKNSITKLAKSLKIS